MTPISTPDPNGNRICNQRWNHRNETTAVENDTAWCPICLNDSKSVEGGI